MNAIETTLCFLIKNDKILLATKKRGFGKDKYNGVGGKIEPGETKEQAMVRECMEEINILPTKYQNFGIITFDEYYKGNREQNILHIYIATEWTGVITESEEMKPEWFDIDKIPYDKMFPDDIYWLPLVIKGKIIEAFFKFDEEFNILSQDIKTLDKKKI